MTSTRLPNGVTVDAAHVGNVPAYVTADGARIASGTVTVPTGASGTAIATGLSTVTFVAASPYSTVVGVAGFAGVHASSPGGGSVLLIGISGAGTASTASGTATWVAIGT